MKAYFMAALFLLGTVNSFASCSKDEDTTEQSRPETGNTATPSVDDDTTATITTNKMEIKIGDRTFTATLADNSTAGAFEALLPLTVTMNELNGNEKYYYLPDDIPSNPTRPGTINAGDLMLYGSSCFVLFYETFRTSYSYTRIGRVDDPQGLAAAVGRGRVRITFETYPKK